MCRSGSIVRQWGFFRAGSFSRAALVCRFASFTVRAMVAAPRYWRRWGKVPISPQYTCGNGPRQAGTKNPVFIGISDGYEYRREREETSNAPHGGAVGGDRPPGRGGGRAQLSHAAR